MIIGVLHSDRLGSWCVGDAAELLAAEVSVVKMLRAMMQTDL